MKKNKTKYFQLIFVLLMMSCNGIEDSHYYQTRKQNSKKEEVTRLSDDRTYELKPPVLKKRESYLWEDGKEFGLTKITKEFFRCKGSPLNPTKIDDSNLDKPLSYSDCEGCLKHSLPLIHGKENVYPVLIDILNYIQKQTKRKVIITCGHRCPIHNIYADNSSKNRTSKHMVGAEVDFYILGMEYTPMDVIELILQFYKTTPGYKGHREYESFARYQQDTDVQIKPWYNKEIFLKLYQKDEGRDVDNRHPYPYICIQVRYDRDEKERVAYSWDQAARGYLRY